MAFSSSYSPVPNRPFTEQDDSLPFSTQLKPQQFKSLTARTLSSSSDDDNDDTTDSLDEQSPLSPLHEINGSYFLHIINIYESLRKLDALINVFKSHIELMGSSRYSKWLFAFIF